MNKIRERIWVVTMNIKKTYRYNKAYSYINSNTLLEARSLVTETETSNDNNKTMKRHILNKPTHKEITYDQIYLTNKSEIEEVGLVSYTAELTEEEYRSILEHDNLFDFDDRVLSQRLIR